MDRDLPASACQVLGLTVFTTTTETQYFLKALIKTLFEIIQAIYLHLKFQLEAILRVLIDSTILPLNFFYVCEALFSTIYYIH